MKSPLAAVVLVALPVAVLAQGPPGSVPARTGKASFRFGNSLVSYGTVKGHFLQSSGHVVVSLDFSRDGNPLGDHLSLSLTVQKPGPVDMDRGMGNGIAYSSGGRAYSYVKGKSQCTVTVTSLTPTSVAGTADCPVVNESAGAGTGALKAVRFEASGD